MYSFDARIRYSEIDSEGRLSIPALVNYFQDCSTFHSDDIGVGLDYMMANHMAWIMSSWQIVINRLPALSERVIVGTFPYEFKKFIGNRNFIMKTADGEELAVANSVWCLIDVQSGKFIPANELMLEKYVLEERLPMDYACKKIQVPEGGVTLEPFTVMKHNIDTNHHVNNGQYVNIATAYLPEGYKVGQVRVEYKKQAFLGDRLYPYIVIEKERCVICLNDEQDKPYVILEYMEGK